MKLCVDAGAAALLETLHRAGHRAYVVGGWAAFRQSGSKQSLWVCWRRPGLVPGWNRQ